MKIRLLFAILLFSFVAKSQFKDDYIKYQSSSFSSVSIDLNADFKTKFGFIYKDTLPPFQRILYSQTVLYGLTVIDHAFLMITDPVDRKLGDYFSWRQWERTWTEPPVHDGDTWHFNWVVHPYMGCQSHLAYRNRGGSLHGAFLVSAFNSTFYEYVVAGAMQQPGISDLIITPIGGFILGESIYWFINKMKSDNYFTTFEKILVIGLDPVEAARHHFKVVEML